MDASQYLDLFLEESQEHLQSLNRNLITLETCPKDIKIMNEIFRSAHTLKGMAGSMGFKNIEQIAHGMESILDNIRSENLKLDASLIDILFQCLDSIEVLLRDIMQSGKETQRNLNEIISRLDHLINKNMNNPTTVEKNHLTINKLTLDQYQLHVVQEAKKIGFIPYCIEIELQETCVMKAARAYIIFKAIETYGEIIYSSPSVQDIEEENFDFSFLLVAVCRVGKEIIKKELNNISEIKKIVVKEILEEDIKNIYADNINEQSSTELPAKTNSIDKYKFAKTTRSIRVDIEKLDLLMNLVSELIIIKNRIEDIGQYDSIPGMTESVEYLGRVTNELHDAVTEVRMLPIQMVFNRFPRVVRDLSKNTGKEVQFNIMGAETEVDRTIIDEIGDPLIHLIRNAIDHGIESPKERIMLGKSSTGNLDLKAYHDGNNVVIEVSDDGKGIDIDNVYNHAIEQKLFQHHELIDGLNDQEILQFLFQPGFSTAEKVSNISGRGVGLDVVKTKIESLGGTIDIESNQGIGTKFIVRLPLTLSIIQALLVEIGTEIYAIPLASIKEIVDIPSKDIRLLRNKEAINYRGLLIPLIRLNEVLGCSNYDIENKEHITGVIVNKGEKLAFLSIGKLIGQQEIVIKSLGKVLANIKIVSGATILGNGEVALIIDVNHLI